MDSKEQVERIKEILPNCIEREIYKALDYCKMDSDDAAERLLSRVETEKNRGAVPMEGKEKVEHIKKMVPRLAEEMIRKVLKQCNKDSNPAIQRLLSQETGKNRDRSPMERKEQFECIKEMAPCLTEEDQEGVPTEWKEQVEHIKEMTPCFTRETISPDSDLTLPGLLSPGSPLNDFSSPPCSAKSSVTSQLHHISLDKGKEVVWHMEDDAATTSRSNVRALSVMGRQSSHALQAASDSMALGNSMALGSSEFLEFELFPPPTLQCGIQLMLNDLVANADQPSELRHLLRLPFLETPSVPSGSSAAGSQHPRTSALENGPSGATTSNSATSSIQPFRDPQDLVLDALFACSRYGPIQHPGRISESFEYDMPSAQKEVHQGGSSSRANADASCWESCLGARSTPRGSLTISPAPSDISRTGHDFVLHAQAQHQLRDDYCPAEMEQSPRSPSSNWIPSLDGRLCLPKQIVIVVKDLHCNMLIEAAKPATS